MCTCFVHSNYPTESLKEHPLFRLIIHGETTIADGLTTRQMVSIEDAGIKAVVEFLGRNCWKYALEAILIMVLLISIFIIDGYIL